MSTQRNVAYSTASFTNIYETDCRKSTKPNRYARYSLTVSESQSSTFKLDTNTTNMIRFEKHIFCIIKYNDRMTCVCVRVCASVCECVRVCASVCECVRACMHHGEICVLMVSGILTNKCLRREEM